jgi:hypothetical protein
MHGFAVTTCLLLQKLLGFDILRTRSCSIFFFQSAGKQKKHNEIELFFSSVPWRFSRRGVAKTAAAIQKTIFTIEKKFGQRGA